jgi:hypothetical protein
MPGCAAVVRGVRWAIASLTGRLQGEEARAAPGDAGGAIGRETVDAGTVASRARIKAGEPGEALHGEARAARCR